MSSSIPFTRNSRPAVDRAPLPNGDIPLEPISVSGLQDSTLDPDRYVYNRRPPSKTVENPFEYSLYDLDTLAVFARMLGLMIFVFTLNLSSMPKVPYPFIGNLQDCDPESVPEVWIEGSVIVAIMYGLISVRKILVLIVQYILYQVHSVDLTNNNEENRNSGFVNNALDSTDDVDGRMQKEINIPEQVIFSRFQDPRNVPKPPDLSKSREKQRGHRILANIRNALIGHADLGPSTSNKRTSTHSSASADSITLHMHTLKTIPHIQSPVGALWEPCEVPQPEHAPGPVTTKYTYRIYSNEEDVFRDDNKYCPRYVLPCLLYHLGFGLWLGWACNPHLVYFTSDLEFLIVGSVLFLLGEGMSIGYSVVILRGSTIDNRVLLREGGEVLALAGLTIYSLALPACTLFLVRAILAIAAGLKVIDSRVF